MTGTGTSLDSFEITSAHEDDTFKLHGASQWELREPEVGSFFERGGEGGEYTRRNAQHARALFLPRPFLALSISSFTQLSTRNGVLFSYNTDELKMDGRWEWYSKYTQAYFTTASGIKNKAQNENTL